MTVAAAPMSREARFRQVADLRERGLTHQEIAGQLGISRSTVRNLFNDPDGSKQRARRRTYEGVCERCGGVTKSDGTSKPSRHCAACAKELQQEAKKWTRETVIDAIQRFAAANGRPPYSSEWIRSDPVNGYPPRTSVYESGNRSSAPFGNWSDAIEAAGFARPRVGKRVGDNDWSAETVIAELRARSVDGVAPSCQTDHRLSHAAVRYLGSWVAACRAAGVQTKSEAYGWTAERVLAAIRDRARAGSPPVVRAMPSGCLVAARRNFGSWRRAVEAAGMTPRKQGQHPVELQAA